MIRGLWFAIALLIAVGVGYLLFGRFRVGKVAIRIGVPIDGRLEKSEADWRAELAPDVFRVTRQGGTERAFTGKLYNTTADGEYRCACCAQRLFESTAKFDSGTGWPSFWQPTSDSVLSLFEDRDFLSVRTEVTCSRCDAHLGHVFNDGPPPTGQRYCMNSAALVFVPR